MLACFAQGLVFVHLLCAWFWMLLCMSELLLQMIVILILVTWSFCYDATQINGSMIFLTCNLLWIVSCNPFSNWCFFFFFLVIFFSRALAPCFPRAFNFIVCHPTCKHFSCLSLIPKYKLWKAVLCSTEGLSCDTAGNVNPLSCFNITCLWILFLVQITENLVSSVLFWY